MRYRNPETVPKTVIDAPQHAFGVDFLHCSIHFKDASYCIDPVSRIRLQSFDIAMTVPQLPRLAGSEFKMETHDGQWHREMVQCN